MILEIVWGVPIWVWPLFVFLTFIGIKASKSRLVPIWTIYIMPFWVLLSVANLVQAERALWVWVLFLVSYSVGLFCGQWLQTKWLIVKRGPRVEVAGEWFTLWSIMLIFAASFAGGIATAIWPLLSADPAYFSPLTMLKGALSGVFLGRAVRVWWFVRHAPAPLA